MKLRVIPRTTSLAEFRNAMLDGTRGVNGAFKLALGDAVHWWRKDRLPGHFGSNAYTRYGLNHAGYLQEHRDSRAGITVTVGGRELSPPFSKKELRQAREGWAPDRSPIVFSGRTRAGLTSGQFRVRGTSKVVRGSWNDHRINWQALAARGQELGQSILLTTSGEVENMAAFIREKAFPFYVKMVEKGERLPAMSELPRKA